jgi:integrase/recombinase XerD
MNNDLTALVEAGTIKTSNPWKMGDREIIGYIGMLRSRGMQDSGISHNINHLSNLLHFIGNGALDKARIKYPQHFPKRTYHRLPSIHEDDRARVIEAANKISDKDWIMMESYGLTVTAICTGLRPKELRHANVTDLDLKKGTLHAEEVKGRGRYGEPRNTAVHPDGIPFLKRYIRSRDIMLAKNKMPTVALLFPAMSKIRNGGDGIYSSNSLTKMRKKVNDDCGIAFDLRTCRRTFGQVGIDSGVATESVSRMMGHNSTVTTEKYYARKSQENAISEAQRVWANIRQTVEVARPIEAISPLNKKFSYLPGYG